jgi:hypothetical protein
MLVIDTPAMLAPETVGVASTKNGTVDTYFVAKLPSRLAEVESLEINNT